MKITRRELKRLIETFISGHLGTIDARDPYDNLHQSIKNKFDEKGSMQNPPVSGREYFLMYRGDHETLGQIISLDDTMKSDDQTYVASGPDDSTYDDRTGESMSKQFDIFDDPMGESGYYSFDNILRHYKNTIPDLVVLSQKPHRAYTTGPGKTYIKNHGFYADDVNELTNLKNDLYNNGFKIINDTPQFSGKGGIFKVDSTHGGRVPSSIMGKFGFRALEPKV
jgi:hypothetical protein